MSSLLIDHGCTDMHPPAVASIPLAREDEQVNEFLMTQRMKEGGSCVHLLFTETPLL